jgi:hypothetical protein
METVYTPRVKNGRPFNESPQKHYYGKTAPHPDHSNHNYFYKYLHLHIVLKIVLRRGSSLQKHLKSTSSRSSTRRLILSKLKHKLGDTLQRLTWSSQLRPGDSISSRLSKEGSLDTPMLKDRLIFSRGKKILLRSLMK